MTTQENPAVVRDAEAAHAVVAEVLRHVDELPRVKQELDDDPAAVVFKVAPGRPEYRTNPDVGASSAQLPPTEVASRRQLERLVDDTRRAVEEIERNGPRANLTDDQVFGLEAIVSLMFRPAILVQGGTFFPPPEPWGPVLEPRRRQVEAVMQSVGRIEITGHVEFDWVGTGWLAAQDVVMTNRHVAREFARQNGAAWTFSPGMTASVDFNEQLAAEGPREFGITGVIGVHPTLDLALLRCAPTGPAGALSPPLQITRQPVAAGRKVYVVGYPAADGRRNDPVEMQRIFAGIYNVKRLQPGEVMSVADDKPELKHDCSTLGGNSGSCVVDVETSQVVGLHFGGRYLQGNFAVALWQLQDDPLLRRAGLFG